MEFNELYWPDSNIEEIKIKYDELTLKIYNDLLKKEVIVICKNFAGITNLCMWDDTYIYAEKLETASTEVFYNQILKAYGTFANTETRSLADGLKKLSFTLTNGITCEIYCQSITVEDI